MAMSSRTNGVYHAFKTRLAAFPADSEKDPSLPIGFLSCRSH